MFFCDDTWEHNDTMLLTTIKFTNTTRPKQ